MKIPIGFCDADSPAIQSTFADKFRGDLPKFPSARGTNIFGINRAACGFDMRAALRINQYRFALARDDHILDHPVPAPMTREPHHPAAKGPMMRSAGCDEHIEAELRHLLAR